jgi:hypothetical protein
MVGVVDVTMRIERVTTDHAGLADGPLSVSYIRL